MTQNKNNENKKVLLSGVAPTNRITLGNYLGALKNWVRLQDQYQCYFIAVDMHAITVRQDAAELRENTWFALAAYVASGIDPRRCHLFVQSQVPQHAELAWILNCYTYMGELGRMTQYKDKSAKEGANIGVGLFAYPALMAADILLYQADLVPVGQDQKQHIELTRDVAMRMNHLYGEDLFKIPEPYIPPVGARIKDLQNPQQKMSKSSSGEMGGVYLTDSPKDIEKKFKRAMTDSGTEISYSDDKPGVKNLLEIQSVISGKSIDDLVAGYQGKMYGHLKVDTAEIVIEELRPVQTRIQELLADRGELMRMMQQGALEAREVAGDTLRKVYDRVGFILPT